MTMFRSTTDQDLAARFDPEPWLDDITGERRADSEVMEYRGHFDPRVELIPFYLRWPSGEITDSAFIKQNPNILLYADRGVRPEPNPILVAFRDAIVDGWDFGGAIISYLDNMDDVEDLDATPEHVDHARKVLSRLASL